MMKLWICSLALVVLSCDVGNDPEKEEDLTDAELFTYLTTIDSHTSYFLFPRVDSVVAGSLNGSTAHRPMVRVSLNDRALSSLVNGSLPPGGSFQDSSVILKQIIDGGTTTLWAVVFKKRNDPNAAGGWLWAEFTPDGTVIATLTNKGGGCIGCHSLEQGTQNDLIRTFERQTP